jgi:hypothetical protein
LLPPPPLRLLPGGAIQFPGESFFSLWTNAFSRRTVTAMLRQLTDSFRFLPTNWTEPRSLLTMEVSQGQCSRATEITTGNFCPSSAAFWGGTTATQTAYMKI